MNLTRRVLFRLLFFFVAVVSFQNCNGSDFLVSEKITDSTAESPTAKLSVCESILYNEFLKPEGYYTFLTQKCGTCHNGLGQAPGFASPNTFIAWDKFVVKEIEIDHRISERAVGDHQPGVTGPQNKTTVDRLKEEFAVANNRFQKCEDDEGGQPKTVALLPLTTKSFSLGFLNPKGADKGEDLTNAEKNFLRTEVLKYYVLETASCTSNCTYNEFTQSLVMNPYERPIYDSSGDPLKPWKKFALKKVSTLELNDEEASHIRVEKYKLTDADGQPIMDETGQKEKTYFLNPFQRIKINPANMLPVVDPITFEPIVETLSRGGQYAFKFRQSSYTPDLSSDEPYMTFKIQIFRSQRPITKTEQKVTLKKRTSGTGTLSITFTRTLSYNQILDPYIVIKRPSFVIDADAPSDVYPKYAYQVQNLNIVLNKVAQTDRTIFRILDSVVCEKAPINVMVNSNSEILPIDFAKDNLLDFEFKNVAIHDKNSLAEKNLSCTEDEKLSEDVILPETVTYADLMGATDVNVFKKNCLGCHSASNLAGGFDISSFDRAKEKSVKIVERMNNANSPMPPTGMLAPTSRKLVEKWVNLGSPQ